MQLWRFETANRRRWTAFCALLVIAIAAGCRRDNTVAVDRNRPPETFITFGPEPSNDPRDPSDLFYRAHLFWRGEDTDGTVAGFRFAIDDTADPGAWTWTTKTDSIFRFPVAEIGSQEHLFLIRAVDNLGKQDATPDTARFESFTSANPTCRFDALKTTSTSESGVVRPGVAPGDTVEVFSTVTFVWTGGDEDGEVVGWETKFDQEQTWRFHTRNDTTRTETNVNPGLHTLSVRAIDDAGAKSTQPCRFTFQCNYDPVTRIDRTTVRGSLVRPWMGGDTLIVDLDDGMGGVQDTMPLGCTMEMCWSSTDIDGPVEKYQWKIDQLGGQVDHIGGENAVTCITTTGTLNTSSVDNAPAFVVTVKGIDIYNNVETRPETLRVHVNFRPTVELLGADGQVPVDTTLVDGSPIPTVTVSSSGIHSFQLQGGDVDGPPSALEYRWLFSFDPPFTQPTKLPSRSINQEFDASLENVGASSPHLLIVEAQDSGGASRPSFRDTLAIWVEPPAR